MTAKSVPREAATQETATRPRFPKQYGIPKDPKGMLPWSFVEERMAKARNYWLSTTRPDGTPHARPVDGVWVDSALCFGGSPETRWVRNLQKNPALSVHLGSETEVIILEGKAEFISDAKHALVQTLLEASRAKYPEYYPGTKPLPFRPFWMLRPRVVFAWTLAQFPQSATRWVLDKAAA
jgi:nitroimidazol reductase NimA-like FMN-containing flavoprotein (pyridoxamine 5'-phosphate oxidase superfamily)